MPAAGCGARTGLNGNKILAPLCGKPLLWWTLDALWQSTPLLEAIGFRLVQIVVAARREEFSTLQEIIARHPAPAVFVEGGATRQQSVARVLHSEHARADYVLVHDAARPLATAHLVAQVARAARESSGGGAIAALPASDTVKIVRQENNRRVITSTLPRGEVFLAQTPQVFASQMLREAHDRAAREGFEGTDCASLMEQDGATITVVEGERENFKVTFAADLQRARSILERRSRETQSTLAEDVAAL